MPPAALIFLGCMSNTHQFDKTIQFFMKRGWNKLFAQSQDLLSCLADEAIEEFEQGKTELLAPEKL